MEPTRLYLLRHGQVEGHQEKRYNGQADVPLTETGRAQFGLLQVRLQNKGIDAVYASDLTRCREGAEQLAAAFGVEPVLLPGLRELDIGEWEGRTWEELQKNHPEAWQARLDDIVHYRVPGGESLAQMADRVRKALAGILRNHPGQGVVVVGHGGVNRVILLEAIGAPLERLFHVEQDFGCLNHIDYYPDGRGIVRLLNG